MVALGFAWGLAALNFSNAPLLYTIGLIAGGLWGAVFLQLVMASRRGACAGTRPRDRDRGLCDLHAGLDPGDVVRRPGGPRLRRCPSNVLLIERHEDVANIMPGLQALVYLALFLIVLVRLTLRWRRTPPLERLQLTPVYVCGLVTFLLATGHRDGQPGRPRHLGG